jgi:hypothetical protein
MGLLISVPGASLSAGPALSLLAAAGVCGVSPVQLIPQESTRLPLQSTGLLNLTWNYIKVYFKIDTYNALEVIMMLLKNTPIQRDQLEMVALDQLVPQEHLVRKMEAVLDFSFNYDLVKDVYSEVGRPSIDPVILIKLTFIQYTFGIRSMRQTISEGETNMAYRWFLGYGFHDKVPGDKGTVPASRKLKKYYHVIASTVSYGIDSNKNTQGSSMIISVHECDERTVPVSL